MKKTDVKVGERYALVGHVPKPSRYADLPDDPTPMQAWEVEVVDLAAAYEQKRYHFASSAETRQGIKVRVIERARDGLGGNPWAKETLQIIKSAAYLYAPWDEYVVARDAKRAKLDALRAERRDKNEKVESAIERLTALGVEADDAVRGYGIRIPVAEIDKLLALIEGGDDA